ncbi:hypothetical protein AZI85_05105 [Bdellovibrio bacteriovorus]|uniref:PLD phosphodiesterase domain-containing protein n=2 Tax=Bdellovibrio bacteriovorus TaxID=959 RepID=A0A150WI79_BDEBC|nr:hypothetical protein AZI85_05105 [Bdellovibrio bacteriovorus]
MTYGSKLYKQHKLMNMKLVVFGAFLFLGVLTSCQSIPKDFKAPESYYIKNTEHTWWAKTLAAEIKKHPDQSGFVPLASGPDAFIARLASVRKAERTLDIQYYIWHDDLVGRMLMHDVLQAADRGVRVRLLLDDLNIGQYQDTLLILDSHPLIEVRMFNPFANRKLRFLDAFRFSQVNRRMHNKVMIADNQAAILGGRNIGNEYFTASEEENFGDFDVWCFGPVAEESSQSFDLYWNNKLAVPIPILNKRELKSTELAELRQNLEGAKAEVQKSKYGQDLENSRLMKQVHERDVKAFWGRAKVFYDSPEKVENGKSKLMLNQITALPIRSTKEVFIVSPYFIPGKKGVDYFAKKSKDGIKVTVVTNSLASNDVSLVFAGYKKYRKGLLKGGVDLYEIKPRVNVKARKSKVAGSSGARLGLHGKVYVFDRHVMFVGSMNLDPRSVELNSEMGVLLENKDFANHFVNLMTTELPDIAYKVTLDDGDLRWTTREEEGSVTLKKEPEASFWKSFQAGVLSLFVPESLL